VIWSAKPELPDPLMPVTNVPRGTSNKVKTLGSYEMQPPDVGAGNGPPNLARSDFPSFPKLMGLFWVQTPQMDEELKNAVRMW